MGQAPKTDAVSLRSFNRNFYARSGTKSAGVYLVSPETGAYSALTGVLSDPRDIGEKIEIEMPKEFLINDNLIVAPALESEADSAKVVRGPNIKPFPLNTPLTDKIQAKVLLIMEDNITTDHIMPSNAKLLPYRSNIPHLANFCLEPVDSTFSERAQKEGKSILVAGHNYGQGSSREHAALAPLYLGVKAVIAKSFARIHMANLINSGILPLEFKDEADYDKIGLNDELAFEDLLNQVNNEEVKVLNITKGTEFIAKLAVSNRQRDMLKAGGLLNLTKEQNK